MTSTLLRAAVGTSLALMPAAYFYHEATGKKNLSTRDFSCFFLKTQIPRTELNALCPRKISWKGNAQHEHGSIDCLFSLLEEDFKQSKDLRPFLLTLTEMIDKHPTKSDAAARQLILFLKNHIFQDSVDALISCVYWKIHPISMAFSELEEKKFKKLELLFQFANDLVGKVKDPTLVEELKVLFANLPLKGNRKQFPHLFLSEKDQVTVMVKALRKKEDALVNTIIQRIEEQSIYLTSNEKRILNKLLFSRQDTAAFSLKAELGPENKARLITAWKKAHHTKNRSNIKLIAAQAFDQFDVWERKEHAFLPESTVKLLQRTLKCKAYFQEQARRPANDISIPFWYHSTKREELSTIIGSKALNVYYRKGTDSGYTGAWVSSRVESRLFGRYTIGFSKRIEEEKESRTSLPFNDKRWRGFLKSLSLSDAGMISVKTNKDKEIQSLEKRALSQELKHISDSSYKVTSEQQMIYMQKMITSTLGNPNLSNQLWGYQPET